MYVDTANWIGTDGKAGAYTIVGGKPYGMGVWKDNGVYKLILFGSPQLVFPFPGSSNSWAKYEVWIDIDSGVSELFLNGTRLRSNSAGPSYHNDCVNLGTGDAGLGGGRPSAYFDLITIEKLS
jgi:hypothetical protein